LTEAKLRELQPGDRACKMSDGGTASTLSSHQVVPGPIYSRILADPFGKLNLDEIKPVALGELLDRVKTERGPGPAVHAREGPSSAGASPSLIRQVDQSIMGRGGSKSPRKASICDLGAPERQLVTAEVTAPSTSPPSGTEIPRSAATLVASRKVCVLPDPPTTTIFCP
jgi:hypothetical protein